MITETDYCPIGPVHAPPARASVSAQESQGERMLREWAEHPLNRESGAAALARELVARIALMREHNFTLAERVAAQAELLARRAEAK